MLIPELSTRPLKIVDRYEGGFGRVLIVADDRGETFALKGLKADIVLKGADLAGEALKLAELPPHPHVINIIGFAQHDGASFIILPALDGNLREVVRQGRLAPDQAAVVAGQVAQGLTHLHRCGVLHLDLKPENILVAENGRYVIADFGLSGVLPDVRDLQKLPELTVSALAGTVSYMSPEHFATGHLTPKTDVFALGVVLFELLTGRQPFVAGAPATSAPTLELGRRSVGMLPAIAWRIMHEQPSFTDDERASIPNSLLGVCAACLEKNPANRPAAADIIAMLGAKQEYVPVDTQRTERVNRANALAALGKLDEAERLIEECLQENPFLLPALVLKAECADARGHRDTAIAVAEQAIGVAQWQPPIPPGLGTLLVNLSHYYLAQDPERAIRCARLALEADSADWQALMNLAAGYMNLAQGKSLEGERQELLKKSLGAIRAARQRAPQDLWSLLMLGQVLIELKDLDALRSYITTTVWPKEVLGPRGMNPNVGLILVGCYIELGEFETAEELIRPMRKNPELRRHVEGAERRMAERKRESGLA